MTHKTDGKSSFSSSSSGGDSTKTQGPGTEEYVAHDTSNTDDTRYDTHYRKKHRKYYFYGMALVLLLIYYIDDKAYHEREMQIVEERMKQNSQQNPTNTETLKDA